MRRTTSPLIEMNQKAILFALLALAALLRLGALDRMEFKEDEATALEHASRFVDDGAWPKVGLMASIGVPNPPGFIYLLAIPYALSRDPIFVTAFVALLNVAAAAAAFLFAARAFNRRVALIAALFFAVGPTS